MFAAHMIGTFFAASWISLVWMGSRPVVPITMATPFSLATLACATVASGMVKSITHWAARMAAALSSPISTPLASSPAISPASLPSALEPGLSLAAASVTPSVRAIWRTSIWPMRPEAPTTAIFISFLFSLVGLD